MRPLSTGWATRCRRRTSPVPEWPPRRPSAPLLALSQGRRQPHVQPEYVLSYRSVDLRTARLRQERHCRPLPGRHRPLFAATHWPLSPQERHQRLRAADLEQKLFAPRSTMRRPCSRKNTRDGCADGAVAVSPRPSSKLLERSQSREIPGVGTDSHYDFWWVGLGSRRNAPSPM